MEMTQKFWEEVLPGYEPMVSEVTIAEIGKTKDETRRFEMLGLVKNYSALPVTEEVQRVAGVFSRANLVPENKWEDALHLACAVVNGADYVASWNFDHMVQVRTQKRLPILAAQEGYFRQLLILSPQSFLGGSP